MSSRPSRRQVKRENGILPVIASPPSKLTDHRAQLLSQLKKYENVDVQTPVPLKAIQPLLKSMTTYLSTTGTDQDDFEDNIGDDDFLLVESINSGKHSNSGFDEEQPPSKRLKPDKLDSPNLNESEETIQRDDRTRSIPSTRDTQNEAQSLAVLSMARNLLQQTWGFPSFRLKQEAAIARLIAGGSAAVVFPTGGGKSLAYQIPALAFDLFDEHCGRQPGRGVTLVVSPLIALMKDQVDALRRQGVVAAAMDSSQSRESYLDTCNKLRTGELKLLYVAPERLNNEGFIEMINGLKVRMVAVDEAHCISEWGPAFRPDYLKIARFVREVQAERVLCLTATATPKVADDICAGFEIEKEGLFRTTTYRSNLRLLVKSFKSGVSKIPALVGFLQANHGPTIVYVQTHEQTESVCKDLKLNGFDAYNYHAGMSSDQRTTVQDKFMTSKNIVIVATIAFGMGIDKPDIRNVVHYAIPKTLEGYSQEIGRAGRDGLESACMTFLCGEDIGLMEDWCRADVPSQRSLEGLLGGLMATLRNARAGDVIERNLNDESKEWDIRVNALGLLNAQLELRFELIRAITPKYSEYKYTKCSTFEFMTSDDSKISNAVKQCSKTLKTWTHVDVDNVARTSGLKREDAVRKLQEWHGMGAIQLQPSGVIHRFRVLKTLSNDAWKKLNATISDTVYAQIQQREKEDLVRIQNVIDLVTAQECISRKLARHFGDEDSIPPDGCGSCQFCKTGEKVFYESGGGRKGRIDQEHVRAILAACGIRDDARFLARVGFGISSPRVTQLKLGKHAVFGSCGNCDFEELVRTFSQYCH